MAENSAIEWTSHTFNPWSGCTKVSAGCAHCYAEVNYSVKMRGVKWGPQGNRIVAAESMWKQPVKWNREASTPFPSDVLTSGPRPRPRVFCASLADVFEDWQGPMIRNETELCICHECGEWMFFNQRECKPDCRCDRAPRRLTMSDVRRRLFDLIDATPNLDWLLLTKRPENISPMLKDISNGSYALDRAEGWNLEDTMPNVWLGTSVENQQAADERIPHLLATPAAVRFLSCEPLLGPMVLPSFKCRNAPCVTNEMLRRPNSGGFPCMRCKGEGVELGIDWCIVGGESGPGARPCNVAWVRSIVEQCKAAGVPCFVKQLGQHPIEIEHTRGQPVGLRLRDKKGGDMAEWPSDLRVREFPEAK